ncbi:copper resistance CopC/CopD family protein [Streptomyces sp. NPDC053367]|uniref:copper resistance CopC/CopD family protein n=1 Tax=Streptomyces sp. NPDC053367 TaxID=3365700 RepID=UPI0037D5F788
MTQAIAPRARTLVLLLLAVAGALLAGAAPASAHAALTGSDPRQGAVVDQAPQQVSLTFSESVSLSDDALRVFDPKGKRADTGRASGTGGTTYAVKLHPGLPDGTYTVTYQVVSADSHPVSGAFTFSIGAPSSTAVSVDSRAAAGEGLVGRLYGLGRFVSYAGFVVLVGGCAFVPACWPRGAGVRAVQRLVVSGWVALTAATLTLLLLRGSYTTSSEFGDVFDLDLLGQVLQTKTGAALVSRLLLLAAAALFLAVLFGAYDRREGQEKRDLVFGLGVGGGVVAAGLAASWAMAEHASTGLQPGLAMPVDVVHLLAVAAWLGGLCALLVSLYRAPVETPLGPAAVRRFSRVAFGSVAALVATGVYQSWRQVGSWSALTGTRYGQLLLVKTGLVVLLVGLAWISRRWTSRLAQAPVEAERMAMAAGTRQGEGPAAAERGATAAAASDARDTVTEDAGPERGAVAAAASDAGGTVAGTAATERGAVAAAASDARDTVAEDAGPERAAQLARQRAAAEAARRKQARDADPRRFGLRRSVLAEAAVAVVVLAVTTMLTSTEPGRTEEEADAAKASAAQVSASGTLTLDMPFDTGGEDGKGVVRIDLDPARVGGNELHVYVERPNGRAFDVPEVKLSLTLESKGVGPLPVVPDHITTGHWAASGVQIPMAGDWKVAVTVRTSDIDQATVDKNAKIG